MTMTPATFTDIIRQVKEYTGHVSLHVLGEPLLHPQLALILELCHQHGLRVNLTTNGTLLHQSQETLLTSPALRQINISLHSFPEQGKGAMAATYLADLLAVARRLTIETETYVTLRMWNKEKNTNGTDRDKPIYDALAAHFNLPGHINDTGSGRGIALAPRIYLNQAERFYWPNLFAPEQNNRGTCRGLKDHLAILVDGTVVPCCLDGEGEIKLGNIITQPLAEILAAPRATAMRQAAARQQFEEPLCRRCTYRQRFESFKPKPTLALA